MYLPFHCSSSTLREPGSPEWTGADHVLGQGGESGCLNFFFFTEVDIPVITLKIIDWQFPSGVDAGLMLLVV